MADVRIKDKILSDAVVGWLELEGLASADCVVTDEWGDADSDRPAVVLCPSDESRASVGRRYAAVRCPLQFSRLSEAVRLVTSDVREDEHPAVAEKTDTPSLSRETRAVSYHREEVVLSPREYDLIEYFMSRPNETVTRRELCENVWHGEVTEETNAVDVYVSYLRRRIEPLFGKGAIVSVRGEGYMLVL